MTVISSEIRIAVISDTHGLLRESVCEVLRSVDYIIHAGDVNNAATLQAVRDFAPSYVVRGNTDTGLVVSALPLRDCFTIDGFYFYIMHDLSMLDIDPVEAGINVIISGHTHLPDYSTQGDVIFLNPGSVGPRRYDYPISMALISIVDGAMGIKMIEFDD